MQLKFEPGLFHLTTSILHILNLAPFPAATICNLNAFKSSELRKMAEFEQWVCPSLNYI